MDGKEQGKEAEGRSYRDGNVVRRTAHGWEGTGEKSGSKTIGETLYPNLVKRRIWTSNNRRCLLYCRLKHKTAEDFDINCYGCRFYAVKLSRKPTISMAPMAPMAPMGKRKQRRNHVSKRNPQRNHYRGERIDTKEMQAYLKKKKADRSLFKQALLREKKRRELRQAQRSKCRQFQPPRSCIQNAHHNQETTCVGIRRAQPISKPLLWFDSDGKIVVFPESIEDAQNNEEEHELTFSVSDLNKFHLQKDKAKNLNFAM